MTKSKNFELIKNHYKSGRWDIQRVYLVVGLELGITPEEYQQITGYTYPAME